MVRVGFKGLVIAIALVAGVLFWQLTFKETAVVSEVIDGDTIRLADGKRIRYISVDAPEEEKCFASEAKEINEGLVLGKKVRLEFDKNNMDRFGRYLAYVYVFEEKKEIFVNEDLLAKGLGEFFLDTVNLVHQSQLIKAAEIAHAKKEGLWRACAPEPEVGCVIKGNLDRLDHRWYHLPEFRHYEQVVVNLENGDRWFCTEEEAKRAGFERARE